ncbi:MAG: galactose-1-phosphate uridylyltransferase [Gemmatimonadetes bacterium]|nr:galactose-1-phosphate uridylyltransferase [Gemmatimonadota bacterium]
MTPDETERMPGELRQNVLTGRWVAVAPDRGERPVEGTGTRRDAAGTSDPGSCPFCPGNESALPSITTETPSANGSEWSVRVVPNRYPAFTDTPEESDAEEDAPRRRGRGTTLALGSDVPLVFAEPMAATGKQEVIIETPHHGRDLTDMEVAELEGVVEAYHQRFSAVSEDGEAARVILFRNRGESAGNSLAHPHAQLIATTTIPPEVRVREIRMMGYHGDSGRCLLCSLPNVERAWDRRVVLEDEHFMAVVPFAAEGPYELWIIPRRHQAEFGEAEPEERKALARMLGEVLRRYRERAGDPDYNLMLHSGPRSRSGSRALHWFIQLRPRIGHLAGFEMATGIHINPSSPEADAATLRGESPPEKAAT